MFLDELLARLDRVSHQIAHRTLGLGGIVDAHLEQRARCGFHRGLPQLVGIHLTQALVALDVELVRAAHLGEHGAKRALVVDIALDLGGAGVLLLDAEDRRAGDVDVAAVDELGHVAIEERQQQDADVRAIDIRIGHDDDAVVTRLVGVEILADVGANRRDQRADRVAGQRAVQTSALDVEDLAAQGQNGLEEAVAARLGAAAGAVASAFVSGAVTVGAGSFLPENASINSKTATTKIIAATTHCFVLFFSSIKFSPFLKIN